jgi:hypothetical protein
MLYDERKMELKTQIVLVLAAVSKQKVLSIKLS